MAELMPNSQNGWPVVQKSAVVERTIGGARIVNGWLRGDVDVIFTDLATWLDRSVEASMTPGCWGWYVKEIEGSSTISNHASGTAFDYNAPNHPMGSRNTYSASDRERIRARLKRYDGVVRWGGDYSGRPDDMHFEINKGRAAVKVVADKIRRESEAGPVALTSAEYDEIAKRVHQRVINRPDAIGADASLETILAYLGSREGIANRVKELLFGTGDTGSEGTPLFELRQEVDKIRADMMRLMSDPADSDNPELHPVVMGVRYVNANPTP